MKYSLHIKKFSQRLEKMPLWAWITGGVIGLVLISTSAYVLVFRHDLIRSVIATHGPRLPDLAAQISRDAEYRRVVSEAAASFTRQAAASAAAKAAQAAQGAAAKSGGSAAASGGGSSAASAAIASNSYGIAAGGGLVDYDQASLNQYFTKLKELGIKWVRWDLNWGTIQSGGSSSFDWTGPDRVVTTAKNNGINSLVILNGTPRWARLSACSSDDHCAPADPAAFGKFAGQVAARYAPQGVHYWEIWNEQNFESSWLPAPDAAGYTNVLKAAHAEIHKVDSGAAVISGGLAAAADGGGDIAPITFVQAMYAQGAKGHFDALALHPYSYPVLPSYNAAWNFWQQMKTIHQIMLSNGDGNRIWITEVGAPTGGPGSAHTTSQLEYTYPDDFMSEAAQAQIAADVIKEYKLSSSWLGPLFWYSLKDLGTSSSDSENFFGLLRFDNSTKPAYDVIWAATH